VLPPDLEGTLIVILSNGTANEIRGRQKIFRSSDSTRRSTLAAL
jgi:hypothetical protein